MLTEGLYSVSRLIDVYIEHNNTTTSSVNSLGIRINSNNSTSNNVKYQEYNNVLILFIKLISQTELFFEKSVKVLFPTDETLHINMVSYCYYC